MSGTRDIRPPRLERFGPKTLTGLLCSHDPAREEAALHAKVAAQWADCLARTSPVPKVNYGVVMRMHDGDRTFDYFCGAEAKVEGRVTTLQLPKLYCAVFRHTGSVSDMPSFMRLVFGTVLPLAGLEPAPDGPGVPELIERYDEHFDHKTGEGAMDVLFPIKE